MKSFSNMSHPDLRIMWGSLKLLRIIMHSSPYIFAGLMTTDSIESLFRDFQDQINISERIDQLILAIEAELPNAPEEKL